MEKVINIFGSSITWGAFDERGGWADRLKNYLMLKGREDFSEVYNLGISGDSTDGLMRRFAIENEVRKPDMIIIDIGTNDSSYLNSKSENYVPLERFENNLIELIRQAQKITQEIVFVGLTAVEEAKTTPVPWATDISYTNENIAIYDAKIKEICEKNNLLFIEMQDLLRNEDLEDGLHPNSKGHEKMFLRVKDFLETKEII